MNYDHPELRERLCAEYALGTLRGAARRRFERLMARDGDLRAQVAWWEERLAQLAWNTRPISVPHRNWDAIQSRLHPPPQSRRTRGLWNNLAFWRGAGVAASILAVALLILLPERAPLTPDAGPERVAVVSEPGSASPGWVLSAAADGTRIRARALAPPEMPEGDVCVLWLVWPDGMVRPVGVLPEEGEMNLPKPDVDRPTFQARLAVTIERAERLPMDSPAGPQVFSGPWLQL